MWGTCPFAVAWLVPALDPCCRRSADLRPPPSACLPLRPVELWQRARRGGGAAAAAGRRPGHQRRAVCGAQVRGGPRGGPRGGARGGPRGEAAGVRLEQPRAGRLIGGGDMLPLPPVDHAVSVNTDAPARYRAATTATWCCRTSLLGRVCTLGVLQGTRALSPFAYTLCPPPPPLGPSPT